MSSKPETGPADTAGNDGGEPAVVEQSKGKKGKYRREKPWDTDDIDHWKEEAFVPPSDMKPFTEESSFATLFPAYREKYLRGVWPDVTRALLRDGIGCELNVVEGSMTVRTTLKTRDPQAIFNARDLIKLLSRSVPIAQALKILEDGVACDVVKIGGMVRSKERFVKRRARLLGPNGATLKALELLTETYILVQGNTVSVMGRHAGLKAARKIIEDCMRNIHPVYGIKALMIKKELAKDPALAGQSWDRFLPKFKKTNPPKRKKPKKDKKKDSEKPLFPPQQQPSKIDLAIESGAYFMAPDERERKRKEERREASKENKEKRKAERDAAFVAPTEAITPSKAASAASIPGTGGKRKREEVGDSLADLKERALKRRAERASATSRAESGADDLSTFVRSAGGSEKKGKKDKKDKKGKKSKK